MIPRWLMLTAGLALAAACAHTKTTDEGAEKQETKQEEPKKAEKSPETPHLSSGGSQLHPGDRKATPVATAPEGLLAPGAEKKIRERLADDGFIAKDADSNDAAMREGLRRFQTAHDLPATGMPDQETVKRLGLDADQIFRKATVKD